MHWIDGQRLRNFILDCQVIKIKQTICNAIKNQDAETGGISDRPGNMVDVFHTLFGVAGLSLLGDNTIKKVDPIFCMPLEVTDRVRKKFGYPKLSLQHEL